MEEHITLIFTLCLVLTPCHSQANLPTLTREVTMSSSGAVCPEASFRCSAVNLPSLLLLWYLNGRPVAQYTLPVIQPDDYPLSFSPAGLDGVTIQILSASLSTDAANSANFLSTLRVANLTTLRGASATTTIGCGSTGARSNVISVNYTASPPNLSFIPQTCSLTSSTRGTAFSLSWNSDPQNSADVYHIQVSPEPSSACPEVRPGQSYNCPGLRLGERYTVIVNASNCNGIQQSTTALNVQLEAPSSPRNVTIIPVYDELEGLNEIRVEWQKVNSSSMSSCAFNEEVTYILTLRNSTGAIIEQVTLDSGCCMGDACSTDNCDGSFEDFPTVDDYSVSLTSASAYGGQLGIATEENIAYSYQSFFNLTISSEDCMTTAICSSPGYSGSCSIMFVDTNQELSGELNSKLEFPPLEVPTTYSISISVTLRNTSYIILRNNFTTQQSDIRLTTTNIGLLATGLLLWLFASFMIVIKIVFFIKYCKGSSLILKVFFTAFMLLVLLMLLSSLIIWIYIAVYVGSQMDTCDSNWQSNRNEFIIASFTLSLLSLLLSFIVILILWSRGRHKKKIIIDGIKDFKDARTCPECKKEFQNLFEKNRCYVCEYIFCNKCCTNWNRTTLRCKKCFGLDVK